MKKLPFFICFSFLLFQINSVNAKTEQEALEECHKKDGWYMEYNYAGKQVGCTPCKKEGEFMYTTYEDCIRCPGRAREKSDKLQACKSCTFDFTSFFHQEGEPPFELCSKYWERNEKNDTYKLKQCPYHSPVLGTHGDSAYIEECLSCNHVVFVQDRENDVDKEDETIRTSKSECSKCPNRIFYYGDPLHSEGVIHDMTHKKEYHDILQEGICVYKTTEIPFIEVNGAKYHCEGFQPIITTEENCKKCGDLRVMADGKCYLKTNAPEDKSKQNLPPAVDFPIRGEVIETKDSDDLTSLWGKERFNRYKLHLNEVLRNIQKGEDINKVDSSTRLSPLELALTVNAKPEIIQALIKKGAVLKKEEEWRYNPLETAIYAVPQEEYVDNVDISRKNYIENVKILLKAGAPAENAISTAIYAKQDEVVGILLDGNYAEANIWGLVNAAGSCNWNTVQRFLNKGVDINQCEGNGVSPLASAAGSGCVEVVEKLIQNGADVNMKGKHYYSDSEGSTALQKALTEYSDHTEVITKLLEAGAKPELTPSDWRYKVGNNTKYIPILQKYGAKGIFLAPAFWKIATEEDVQTLIKNGEDVNALGVGNATPLIYAKQYSENPEKMIAILRQNGAKGGILPWDFSQELTVENIRKQIATGANPNTLCTHERDLDPQKCNGTPLIIAIGQDNVTAVEELLKNNLDLESDNPLFYVLGKGHAWNNEKTTNLEILTLLLKAGTKPNVSESRTIHDMIITSYVTSPLKIAISKKEIETMKLLIQYGADVNDLSGDKTPLMTAVGLYDSPDIVKEMVSLLLNSGADINKQDSDGRNVLYHVHDYRDDSSQLIEMLMKKGANADAKDKYGRTMLMNVIDRSHHENAANIIKMIELGADVYATDNDGITVLDLAKKAGWETYPANKEPKQSIVDILVKKGAKESKKGYAWITPHNTKDKLISKYWKNLTLDKLKRDIQNVSVTKETTFFNIEQPKPKEGGIVYLGTTSMSMDCVYGHDGLSVGAWCVPENYETIKADSQDLKNTLLLNAARYNAPPEIIKYLIELGADVNARDENYMTPIMWASFDNANMKTLELLVKSGAKINARARNGRSAIYYAFATKNNLDVIKKLVELGADINVEDEQFITPADLAWEVFRSEDADIDTLREYLKEVKARDNPHGAMCACSLSREKGTENCSSYIV